MEKSTGRAAAKETSEIFQNLRYERKFIYEHLQPTDLINTEVLTSSFCFREIFHRRSVNNIYYDDQAMSFYHQNVAGDEHRDKYRLRWYGDNFNKIESPTLEIKKKMGAVGDKLSFKLPSINLNLSKGPLAGLREALKTAVNNTNSSELSFKMSLLSPSLFNSYERRYFLSNCEKFRITIDYNMSFYSPETVNYPASHRAISDTVLELKYKVEDDKEARDLTQSFSARLSKNSKYVRGVNLINNHKET